MNTIYKDLIVALILASIGAAAAWTIQGWRLDAVRANYATFVATTKAEGEAAQKATAVREAADKLRQEQADRENARIHAIDIDTIVRLRHANDAARRIVPEAPAASARPDLACFDRAGLERALGGFLAEARTIVDAGTAATIDLDTAKLWAQQQTEVQHGASH